MQLQEQGRLDIDKDISAYMGVRVRSPKYPDAVITTRMLMTHTSGVIGGAAYDKNTGDPPYQPLTAVLGSSGCFTGSRPGKSFRYSNMGAAMEGGVIEGVTGKRFYDYAGEQFAALGMDAGYLRTKIKDTASISPARSADVPNWKRVEGAYEYHSAGADVLAWARGSDHLRPGFGPVRYRAGRGWLHENPPDSVHRIGEGHQHRLQPFG